MKSGLISKFNLVGPDEEYTDEVLKKFKSRGSDHRHGRRTQPSTQKLSLSIKEMIKRSQQSEIAKYIHDEDDESDTFSLADMVRYKDEEKDGN